MSKRTLVLGLICLGCLAETGSAEQLNDRTQKLLESQALNAPPATSPAQKPVASSSLNASPNFGPTHGVFQPPVAVGGGAGKITTIKR